MSAAYVFPRKKAALTAIYCALKHNIAVKHTLPCDHDISQQDFVPNMAKAAVFNCFVYHRKVK